MLEINKAEYINDYTINLTFNNGRTGIVDLEQIIFDDNRHVFSPLREKSQFKNFKVEHSTLIWSDELDIAPEYLFYLAFKSDPTLQDQFKQWGYIVDN